MHLLIIGGTKFLGPHLIDAARLAGHQLTLFNRGQTGQTRLPGVEVLLGDRDGGLTPLRGRRFDAVIDTCGYYPRLVGASAELLAGQTPHYTFISSISAYADFSTPDIGEDAPAATIDDPTVEEIREDTYGALKVLCEREVQAAFPDGALIVRPGLIVGPLDPTDRFTYWVGRVAEGGEVLAPQPAERAVQIIDARDLAEWTIRMVEQRATGLFNATGPDYWLAMEELLAACATAAKSDARLTWVSAAFLSEQGVAPWTDIPIWIPGPEYAGFMRADISRALAAGLTFRSLHETIADTLAWHRSRPAHHEWKAGLTGERERALLAAWAKRNAP